MQAGVLAFRLPADGGRTCGFAVERPTRPAFALMVPGNFARKAAVRTAVDRIAFNVVRE